MARSAYLGTTLRLVAVAAMLLFAGLLLTTRPAFAAAPDAPDGPTQVVTPTVPPDVNPKPNPDIPPGPGDLKPKQPCNPDLGNCPPDPCVENPDAEGCTPDPCVENPNAEGCDGGPGGDIPTPTRIDTGAGGTADSTTGSTADRHVGWALAGLLTAAGLLALGTGLARRVSTAGARREQR